MAKINKVYLKLVSNKDVVNVLILSILFGLFIYFYEQSWGNYIEHSFFSSILLAFVVSSFANGISTLASSHFEDSKKLNLENSAIPKLYHNYKNIFITYDNDGSHIVLPITIEQHIHSDTNVKIVDVNEMYTLPEMVDKNIEKIMEAHKFSTVYNQLNIRLDKISIQENHINLHTSRTTYFNSLATNRAMDYEFVNGLTVRKLYGYGPFLPKLEHSQLSNHIGFNGFIKTSDGYFIFIKRSKNMSIAKNTIGCGVSASLKSMYALDEERKFTFDGLKNGIKQELNDELKISSEHFNLNNNCNIIAIYRDWIEGGKPQFLILVDIDLTKENVLALFTEDTKTKNKKQTDLISKMKKDGKELIFIHETKLNSLKIISDGLTQIDGKEYQIIPTTIGLIVFLIDYIKK